jgi:hypothetical protein
MHTYRLTKYDPRRREPDGAYLKDDWTSIADIGQVIAGAIFTQEQYLAVEAAHVQTVIRLCHRAGVDSLSVSDLERRNTTLMRDLDDGVLERCSEVSNGMSVAQQQLEHVIRGCLREYIWCRLFDSAGSYIHFGYDYYVYVGLPEAADPGSIAPGLFLEECESPYLELDN